MMNFLKKLFGSSGEVPHDQPIRSAKKLTDLLSDKRRTR